ncbi:MAG: hypothetical protein WD021_10010 [Rhodothermales bacterium]
MVRLMLIALFAGACWIQPAFAQSLTAEQQIAAAVSPLPDEYKEGAEVRVFADDGLETLRPGSNDMICLGDQPGDDRFHVACYHDSLEPFMERGRTLRAEGHDDDTVRQIREEEARSGQLNMPEQAAALYSLTGPPDSFDPEDMTVSGATPLHVVYMPYATTESTGLPSGAPRGQPWLMNPGMPWAHMMLVGPEASDGGSQ